MQQLQQEHDLLEPQLAPPAILKLIKVGNQVDTAMR